MRQDKFYRNVESNAFFNRWAAKKEGFLYLRKNKKTIYDQLQKNINLKNLNVLEIGCFIGDLLNHLKKKNNCKVKGVEPSNKACLYAKKKFNLKLINSTFFNSNYFGANKKYQNKFDLIIFDDVLSWIERDLILQCLSSADWMLKEEGYIYLRDFAPRQNFAVRNHHWPKKNIYNFKQAKGHKNIFLETGKYIEIFSKQYRTSKLQIIKSSNPQSSIWSDTIIKKIKFFTHPVKKL